MSDIVNKNENLELELEDNTILSNLFGINDRNLSLIEQINQVKIQYRGNKIKISGNKKSIFETKKTILNLFKEAQNGAEIDEDRIRDNKSLISMNIKSDKQMDLFIQIKKRKIIPRTEIQNKYLQLLNTKNIIFAIGPAGTGKTYLAVAKAVSALQDGKVNKIILSRPDILFISVGGGIKSYNGSEASQIVKKLKPSIVIPVHFLKNKNIGDVCDFSNADLFLENMQDFKVKYLGKRFEINSKRIDKNTIYIFKD